MAEKYLTTRIWAKTLKKLRLVAALTGATIVAVIDRLVSKELERLK